MIEDLKSALFCASIGAFFFVGCGIGNEFGIIIIIQSVLSGIVMLRCEDERDQNKRLKQKLSQTRVLERKNLNEKI